MRNALLIALIALLLLATSVFSVSVLQLSKNNIDIPIEFPVSDDHSVSVIRLFSIVQQEPLTGCAEDKLEKHFLLRNKGNTPDVYTITANGKMLRLALLPYKEQSFSLKHEPKDGKEMMLTVTPMFGKPKTYALRWDVKPCVDVQLSLPEEIHGCAEKLISLQYGVLNNGTMKEDILFIFSPILANESAVNVSLLLEAGSNVTKTVTFIPAGNQLTVTSFLRNKQSGKTTVHLGILPQCSQLAAEGVSLKEGKWIISLVNKGTEGATYAFRIEKPTEAILETTHLTLQPKEEGEIVLGGNITGSQDTVFTARTDNSSQTIRVYLDTHKPIIQWKNVDAYAPTIGMTVLIPLLLTIAVFFIVSRMREDDFELKKSWFGKGSYDTIDFDHLFEENETYHAILPRKRVPRHVMVFFAGALLLVIGSAGIYSLYPEDAPWIVFSVGVIVTAAALIMAGLWAFWRKLRRWHTKQRVAGKSPWKWILVFVGVLILLVAGWRYYPAVAFYIPDINGTIVNTTAFFSTMYANNTMYTNTSTEATSTKASTEDMLTNDTRTIMMNETTEEPVNGLHKTLWRNAIAIVNQLKDSRTGLVLFSFATVFVLVLLVSIAKKTWRALQNRMQQQEDIHRVETLTKRIARVEKRTHALKKEFGKKNVWDKVVDFFFED